MNCHLYMTCYRVEALVASQLDPVEFGKYMAVGSEELSRGHLMFFEVDPDFRSDFFPLQEVKDRCVPGPDGRPKASVYAGIYRVLEHIPAGSLGELHLVTRDGRVLSIEPQEYGQPPENGRAHLYQELCPLTPLVASAMDPPGFIRYMTDPDSPVSVPRIFFSDLVTARDESGHLARYLPYGQTAHIEKCLDLVEQADGKPTKTVDRGHGTQFSWRTIGKGFYLGSGEEFAYYPYPTHEQFQREYYQWWRSASLGL
jgi:hypothetical protein